MNVPSYQFLAFAAAVAVLINLRATANWRSAVLLVANVLFVLTFTHAPLAILPFAALLGLGFVFLKFLEIHKSKALFVGALIVLIATFCWLKRYTFVPHELFLTYAYLTVGMSYVFFRILHLVIDGYQETLPERVSVLSYANYTLNFTSLVSGPIQLYGDYRRNETQPAPLDFAISARALERIVAGFFKVAIVSPALASLQSYFINSLVTAGTPGGRVACAAAVVFIFPVYLYLNFSGYMDFVIGLARFMRVELPENFDRPFLALGYIEFWGRWHMTLSNWLKTYVFSPLTMALIRRFPSPDIEAMLGVLVYFVTFFLVGLWHGQTAMFLVFGVLQGLGVSFNKLCQIFMIKRLGRAGYRALCARPVYAAFSRGLTFWWFALSLLCFWSTPAQLRDFWALLGPAGAASSAALLLLSATLLLWVLSVLTAWFARETGRPRSALRSPYARTAWSTALLVIAVSITIALNAPAPHIVYRAF